MVRGAYLHPLFVCSNAQLPPHTLTDMFVNRPRCQALIPKDFLGTWGVIHAATGFTGRIELELTYYLDA